MTYYYRKCLCFADMTGSRFDALTWDIGDKIAWIAAFQFPLASRYVYGYGRTREEACRSLWIALVDYYGVKDDAVSDDMLSKIAVVF